MVIIKYYKINLVIITSTYEEKETNATKMLQYIINYSPTGLHVQMYKTKST